MPLREYECPKCQVLIERYVTSSETEEQECPHCLTPLKRLFSAIGSYTIHGSNGSSTRPRKSRATQIKKI